MKNKHLSVFLITVTLGSGLFAYQLSAHTGINSHLVGQEHSQLQMLDQRLATKVLEFMELSDLLGKQLDQARIAQNRDHKDPLLVDSQPEPASVQIIETPITISKPVVQAPKRAPWWAGYRLSMVVVSNGARSAVINGRYVQAGDTLRSGIRVYRVDPGQVVLVRAGKLATLSMK